MKANKVLSAILAAGMIFSLAACDFGGSTDSESDKTSASEKTEDYIKLNMEYNGAEVSVIAEPFLKYLSAETEEDAIKILKEYEKTAIVQNFLIKWESDGSSQYVVRLADNEEMTGASVFVTNRTICNLGGTLIPDKTYYYQVIGEAKESRVDSFKVGGTVRPITADGADNVRDLGGWKMDGGSIPYGLIYRGGKINDGTKCALKDSGLKTMRETLGIKTEIDLRFADIDDGGQKTSVLGDDVNYVKAGYHGYNYILPEFSHYGVNDRSYYAASADSIKRIFTALADENNYPVYFHCNAGADRTGTLAILIEVLLGVSEADITRDFELTTFSSYGARYRGKIENGRFAGGVMQDDSNNFVAFGYFIERIKAVYCKDGETLGQGVEKYLKEVCSVTDEEISSIRKILTKRKEE